MFKGREQQIQWELSSLQSPGGVTAVTVHALGKGRLPRQMVQFNAAWEQEQLVAATLTQRVNFPPGTTLLLPNGTDTGMNEGRQTQLNG